MPIHLYTCYILIAWCLHSMEKIKDNGVRHAILNDLHTIMYMPIELSENIETFMTHGRNKVIESFTQHLLKDSWTWYFWTYYFEFSTWLSSQSIIVVPPCCAYPKISTPWIIVETLMIQTIWCGYYVSYCKFVDVRTLTSAIFKPRHTSIHWILPWGIGMLVFLETRRFQG